MRHVLKHLERWANERPLAVAIAHAQSCSRQREWTWSALRTTVASLAATIRHDQRPGSVVMLCSGNRPEFIAAFLGTLAADMVVFPVHPGLTGEELRDAATRSGATAFIGSIEAFSAIGPSSLRFIDIEIIENMARDAQPAVPLTHAAMLLQSSGTTGRPKIVRRSGSALDAVALAVRSAIRLESDDHVLVTIPLCHSYGVESALLGPILSGAALHICTGFDPGFVVEQLGQAGITVFPGVPFMWQTLSERRENLSAAWLRMAYSAGGPLPRSVFDKFAGAYGLRIGQLYGSTEIGSCTFNDPTAASFDPSSVGLPMRGVEVRIVDPETQDAQSPLAANTEGHIAVRSPSMLAGYVDDDSPVFRDGYFLTGDLGHLDERGHLFITGRAKLQIDVGGFKVNPLEVEAVVLQHPAVRECVVAAMPMAATVDRLKAIVVLHSHAVVTTQELRQFVRSHLAAYKVPRVIEMRLTLPRSPAGKVLREQCE
jgi:long-chain acyl-CoA synthetase